MGRRFERLGAEIFPLDAIPVPCHLLVMTLLKTISPTLPELTPAERQFWHSLCISGYEANRLGSQMQAEVPTG